MMANPQLDVPEAFARHLYTMPNRPLTILENQEADPWKDNPSSPPYLVVDHIRSAPSRYTIDGVHEYIGRMQVAVVVKAGSFTAQANALAEAVAAHFAADTVIPVGTGSIRVLEMPWIVDGIQDGIRWRVPVQIRYRFLA